MDGTSNSIDDSIVRLIPDDKKSREELIQELAELRANPALLTPKYPEQVEKIIPSSLKTRRENQEIISKWFLLSPSLMFLSEIDTGIFIEVNESYCTFTGYTREELVGRSSLDMGIITAENRNEIARQLQERGRVQKMEAQIVAKTKEIKTCLFSAEKLEYQGRDCLICSGIDITERKRMEALLARNEERFRLMFMNAPMPYQSLDEYGNFLEVNESLVAVLGYSREELIGRNFGDLLDPEWVDHFKENFPRFKAVGEVLGVEFRMVKKNGDAILVFFNGRIQRDDRGRFQRTHCILQDITAQKQAEAALRQEREIAETDRNRLKAVLEVLPVPVFIADADGKVVSTNQEADATWGEAPLSEQPTQYGDDYKAWWPDTGKRVQAHEWGMARAISKGERCIAEEMEIETRDGRRKTILNYALPIRDEKGQITGGVAVNVDITDRKQAEENLKRLNETLEQQVWERTALAEARSKQLQALSAELIEAEERERRRFSELLHEDLQQDLASARFQVQAANQSLPSPLPVLTEIERLLAETIGKSRRLSHELSPAILNHSGLEDALEWLVRHMEEQFGLRIGLKSETTQAIESEAVKILLFRAVQELLFNTFKHAGVKTARVILSEFDGCVVISVSDPGKGFDPELLHSDTVKEGLGLVSLRERIHYIGGSMEIESAPGQGSRVILSVPVDLKKSDESECDEPTAEAHGSAPAEDTDAIENKILRVLFADDHQVMREGLISLVTDQPGIQLAGEAENGLQALELTRQLRPEVVVMDINMPEMDGIEATRRIKTEMPDVRVIGLSMYEDEAIAAAIKQAGAEAFVNKTASTDELLTAIYGIDRPQE